ncbi:MAG: c-type cytochrome [Pseudomonadota bacterium]
MRKNISVLVLAGLAMAAGGTVAAVAQSGPAGDADGAFVNGAKFSEPTGEAMYRRVCAGCHMPKGEGVSTGAGFYPALAANPKLEAGGYPVYILLNGMNGMPPVGRMMTDQQVAEVVNYVRTHFGNSYNDAVTAEEVKALR